MNKDDSAEVPCIAGDPDPDRDGPDLDGTVSWQELLNEAVTRLSNGDIVDAEISARRIVEEASGFEGAELHLGLSERATARGVARFDAMIGRRLTGEPLQYVLGRWSFRELDLMVDKRVLIPRPETEEVAGWALDELNEVRDGPAVVVDLGTGSGAIGLSVLVEAVDVDCWLTDVSADALAVARANLVGLGVAAARGRVAEGSWFEAIPDELEGTIDLIVSNPPYVPDAVELEAVVADWEPSGALFAGPTGLEDLSALASEAGRWLKPGGAFVVELSPEQAEGFADQLRPSFVDVRIRHDLSGRARAVLARTPS